MRSIGVVAVSLGFALAAASSVAADNGTPTTPTTTSTATTTTVTTTATKPTPVPPPVSPFHDPAHSNNNWRVQVYGDLVCSTKKGYRTGNGCHRTGFPGTVIAVSGASR